MVAKKQFSLPAFNNHMTRKHWIGNKALSNADKTRALGYIAETVIKTLIGGTSFSMPAAFFSVAQNTVLFSAASRLLVVREGKLEKPDVTAGIWGVTKGDEGGISEHNSLFTSSLRHQSGCRRYGAFSADTNAFSGRGVTNERRTGEKRKDREGGGGGGGMLYIEEPVFDDGARAKRQKGDKSF